MTGQAAASVLSMEDEIVVRALQPVFHSGLFRVYTNTDLLGCELGGVLKNIIAIAVGMGDGLGAGDNTRAGLMTRGLAEITRLGVAMRSEEHTSELQSLMRISYAVFCLKKKNTQDNLLDHTTTQ